MIAFVQCEFSGNARAAETCELALAATRRMWPMGWYMQAAVLDNLAWVARDQGRPEDELFLDRQALAVCE